MLNSRTQKCSQGEGHKLEMETVIPVVNTIWPILVAFVGLVIVLAKMHASIHTLQEKVKVLFDLHNQKKD